MSHEPAPPPHPEELIVSRRWTTNRRYYSAHVLKDLLGDWQLVRVWGGRGTRLGCYSITPTATQAEAVALLEREEARRRRRGYVPTLWGHQTAQTAAGDQTD